jgi:hypothetical protein
VSLEGVGATRAALLRDKRAGFFVTDPLDRQYLVLPKSVADSWGKQFIADLRRAVDEMYPQVQGYDPIVITYNDRGPRTYVDQGNAILEAVQAECNKAGYVLVMIHHTTDRHYRDHDKLAAMVVRRLRELDLPAAVMHSATGQECYAVGREADGRPCYRARQDRRGQLAGYMRMVALNKVLLTNERWPFVLATPLHADVTVAIDVKHNTAGFTIVGRHGSAVRRETHISNQKERLLAPQTKKYLMQIIRAEAHTQKNLLKTFVLHRDGRVFQSELEGARDALGALKAEGTVDPDATLTILEISKSSPVPFRLFEVNREPGRFDWIENPQVGTWHAVGSDGYVCATGRPFTHPGTVQPLHIRKVEGPLPLRDCLEDVYYLTALTWTKPDDCTRYPIDIKLNDRRLGDDATEYDSDALDFESAKTQEAMR